MPALEADPCPTPGVGSTQGQALPTAPAQGPASATPAPRRCPFIPREIPWGQSRPAAPCAPSHEQNHQPPTCAMAPAPGTGLAASSRSRALAELVPARSRAQLVPEHGWAQLGPGWSLLTASVPRAAGQAGTARARGCSRMLCAGRAQPPIGVVEMRSQNTTFPSLHHLPHTRAGRGPAPSPPAPLWEPDARLCPLQPVLHRPLPLQQGEGPWSRGGFEQPRLSPPGVQVLSQRRFPSVLSQREPAGSFLLFPPFPWTCFPREVQERPGRQTLLRLGTGSPTPAALPALLSPLRSLTVGQGDGT